MDRLSKKVIDALSDARFPTVTFVHDIHREPIDTQEMFIYAFLRYADFMAKEYNMGRLHPDFYAIGSWCSELIHNMESVNS